MRKSIFCFIALFILMSLFTACSSFQKNDAITTNCIQDDDLNSFPEGPYVKTSASWPIYSNSQDLINTADMVFVGKITGISFSVLDLSTALPVSETTEDYLRALHTIYDVEVITSYKGNTSQVKNFRVYGGIVGYRVEEQLEIMEKEKSLYWENGTIPIWNNYEKVQCSVGESYLFLLCQFEFGAPTILNIDQSIYSLENPLKKQTIGKRNKEYFTGDKDDYGHPIISPKDIISEFGQEKWETFWKQWQADNAK